MSDEIEDIEQNDLNEVFEEENYKELQAEQFGESLKKESEKELVIRHLQITDEKDSIEYGTPKFGVIKVYCNFNKLEDAKAKISKAIEARKFMVLQMVVE